MSELDVHRIICPAIERERDELRARLRQAEEIILKLRSQLRIDHPNLPDPYDGTMWQIIEKAFIA